MGFSIDYGARLRVLIVDSDVDSATTLSYLLQIVGCRTAVAFGASMAARVAMLFQPALVLLDEEILNESGGDVLQALRTLDGPVSNCLLVCLVAEQDCRDVQRWLAAGCDGVVCKPLEPQVLSELLTQAQAVAEVQRCRLKFDSAGGLPSPGLDNTSADACAVSSCSTGQHWRGVL
jgi:DNA-binding response OmpR family regulator